MSATDLPPAPQSYVDPDDDAPEPRTPLRRWLLAAALAVPVSAAYGAVVMLVARAVFLDDAAAAALREKISTAPLPLLAIVGTSMAFGGLIHVVRAALDYRAAVREGRTPEWPIQGAAPWVWPVVFTISPVIALTIAALITAATQAFSHLDQGEPAVLFAGLAGIWLSALLGLGAVVVARRNVRAELDESAMEGIEDTWFQKAAASSFWDVMTLVGLATFVLSVWRVDLDAQTALFGVLIVVMMDYPLRLWLLKRREERA